LQLPLGLVRLAVSLELGVADEPAGDQLERSFDLLGRSGDAVLVQMVCLSMVLDDGVGGSAGSTVQGVC
jgi:hypothetical protein